MSILNFPDTAGKPTDGSFTYEENNTIYVWDGVKWTASSEVNPNPTFESINGGQLAGLRNLLINGDARIAQRGLPLSGTTAGDTTVYSFDRWIMGVKAGRGWGADVGSRDNRNTMIFNSTGGEYEVGQYIELLNCWQLPDKVVTISYWAKAATTITPNVGVGWFEPSNNSTIPGADPSVITPVTITTSWQYFTHTFTVPSGSFSYKETYALNVGWSAIPSGAAIELQDVQLEEGPVATPFERRPYGMELDLCQRYYQIRSNGAIDPLDLRPSMRVTPTTVGGTFDAELQ